MRDSSKMVKMTEEKEEGKERGRKTAERSGAGMENPGIRVSVKKKKKGRNMSLAET